MASAAVTFPVSGAFEQEREFRLDARMDEAALGEGRAFLEPHRVGEPAPDDLVDVDLLHLCARGEAHLDADELLATLEAAIDRRRLDGVGFGDAERRGFGELGDRGGGARRLVYDRCKLGDVGHWAAAWASRWRTMSSATSMIMSSWPPTMRRFPSSVRMSRVSTP